MKFNELSESAKEKAINDLVNFYWYERNYLRVKNMNIIAKRLKKAENLKLTDSDRQEIANEVFKKNRSELLSDISNVLSNVSEDCLEKIKENEDIMNSPSSLWDERSTYFHYEEICRQDIFNILEEKYNIEKPIDDEYLFDDNYIFICQKLAEKVYKLARAIALDF